MRTVYFILTEHREIIPATSLDLLELPPRVRGRCISITEVPNSVKRETVFSMAHMLRDFIFSQNSFEWETFKRAFNRFVELKAKNKYYAELLAGRAYALDFSVYKISKEISDKTGEAFETVKKRVSKHLKEDSSALLTWIDTITALGGRIKVEWDYSSYKGFPELKEPIKDVSGYERDSTAEDERIWVELYKNGHYEHLKGRLEKSKNVVVPTAQELDSFNRTLVEMFEASRYKTSVSDEEDDYDDDDFVPF